MSAKFNNILKVDGVILPDPSDMTIEDYDYSESKRVASGKMRGQLIREDIHKIVCKWALLRPDEYMIIRKAIKKKFGLNVCFYIPDQNAEGKLEMYAGDRKTPVYIYENGRPVYKGFTLNFIEM